ncbi:glutathione transport system permease protein GsiD [Spirochaetia bacterium]|nr:glutathione transport system permease protein GsiD [Spirochaetia bacterium]
MDKQIKTESPAKVPAAVSAANYLDGPAFKTSGRFKSLVEKFCRRKPAVAAVFFIFFLLLMAVTGSFFTPYDPVQPDYENLLEGPTLKHLMGTDEYGRDLLSRLLTGARLSLGVALSAVVVGSVIGTVLGIMAGYYGGVLESLVMRGADILFAMPDILLCIAVMIIIGPGIINVVIAVAVFTIPGFARIMRSATLVAKESLYVEVARSVGCKDSRILFAYIFPNIVQSAIVNFTMRIGSAILAAASLSFLGFGASVTEPDWGGILSIGRNYFGVAGHLLYFPGLLIFLTVLAFNQFGDGLRDTLDPKVR